MKRFVNLNKFMPMATLTISFACFLANLKVVGFFNEKENKHTMIKLPLQKKCNTDSRRLQAILNLTL